jgi:selenide,water dikinase
MNLVLFPENQPLEILKEMLLGGQDKVSESGGVMMGGHTITDDIPKYGLAVTGWVHPNRIITNDAAKSGDVLILTKQIGTGVIISAWKNGLINEPLYREAIDSMKLLNMHGADIMQKYNVKCATDVTGFGLAGHAMKMAKGSKVSFHFNSSKIPVFDQVIDLIDMGVIPGASFRNKEFAGEDCHFENTIDYNHKIMFFDAQTSGGLLMCVEKSNADKVLSDLKESGYPHSAIVGEVREQDTKHVFVK